MKRVLSALCSAVVALVCALCPSYTVAAGEGPTVSAAAHILIEADTRTVLCGGRAHEKLPMASTTKIMTALLALELCALDELVPVPDEAYGVEGSSMYLERGEKMSVKDLLYGLMLVSGNDAAITLAVHMGKSTEGFAKLMNARARELGAINSNFVTPNGLPDDAHYTTAYDLALIAAKAMEYDAFRELVSTSYYRTETGNVARTLKSKNKLLWQYEGGCGIKTGYTKAAGKCLVFAAERDGMTLIGVVLNCPDMFEQAKAILDWGYENYEMTAVVRAGDTVASVRVYNGIKSSLAVCAKHDIIIPVKKGENIGIRLFTDVELPPGVAAPVEAGAKLGMLRVYADGGTRLAAQCELVAAITVESRSYTDWLGRLVRRWYA